MGALGAFSIDESSCIPIWIQIRRRIVFMIESGGFEEDQKLPSVRELSVDLGVNYNTVNKVYQDLERDGYTRTKRGLGTYVSPGKKAKDEESNELDGMIESMVEFALSQGVTTEELLEAVRRNLAQRGVEK